MIELDPFPSVPNVIETDSTGEAPAGLSLYNGETVKTFPKDYVPTHAQRMHLALGEKSPGVEVLTSDVADGHADRWKDLLAENVRLKNQQRRQQLIGEVAAQRDPLAQPTTTEIDLITGLSDAQLDDPNLDTLLEQEVSNLGVNRLSADPDNVLFAPAVAENPEETFEVLDRAQFATQRVLIAQEGYERVRKVAEDASWAEAGLAWAKTVIPGYTWWKTVDRIDSPAVSWLQGNNLAEQVSHLYSLPPEQMKTALNQALDELSNDNYVLAREFARAVLSFGTSDQAWGNVGTVLDVASVVPVGALTSATARLGRGTAKLAKAIKRAPEDVGGIAGDVGLQRTGAIQKVLQDTQRQGGAGIVAPRTFADLEDRLPSLFSPGKLFSEEINLAQAAQNRLRQTILSSAETSRKFLTDPQLVDTLEPYQLQRAAEIAFNEVTDHFRHVGNHIIDTGPKIIPAAEDPLMNTAQIAVRIGQRDGTMFATEEAARNFVRRNIGSKTRDWEIKEDGVGGFYVEVTRNLTGTGDIRNLTIPTEFKTPDTIATAALRGLRAADYELPQQNVMARGRVVHGKEYMDVAVRNITKPFAGKSKEFWDDMDRVWLHNRQTERWFGNQAEFEGEFLRITGKMPTRDHFEVYEVHRQLWDLDYVIRDADIGKQKAWLGMEKIGLRVTDETDPASFRKTHADQIQEMEARGLKVNVRPNRSKTMEFDGRVVDSIPYASKDPFRIAVIENGKIGRKYFSRSVTAERRKTFQDLIDQGYKVVLHPEEMTYYLTRDLQRSKIGLGNLPYRPGRHEYRYDWYIKQGDLSVGSDTVSRYKGDITWASSPTKAHADEVASTLEQGRQKALRGDADLAEWWAKNADDLIPYGKFQALVQKGVLRLNTPILATRRGQRTSDVNQYLAGVDNLLDSTANEHNLLQRVTGRYISERSEEVLDVALSQGGKIIKSDQDALMSPMDALQASMGNMMDVRLGNDYKMKASADWVQEFGHLLDVNPQAARANPWYYMNNPQYSSGADAIQRRRAEGVRLRTLDLNMKHSYMDGAVEAFKNRLTEVINPDGTEQGWRAWMSDKVLPLAPNADILMRAAATNMKLGFWNPKQFFLNASEVAKITAISPMHSVAGWRSLAINRVALTNDNPEVIRGLANKWSRMMGWDKNDWIEMITSFKNSGFSTVGRDVAYLDDFRPVNILDQTNVRSVFQSHMKPWREGELVARNLAYATAWREHRAANPGKVFDRFDQTRILQRSKDLTNNMTRDSNAVWQRGAPSVLTQFFSYSTRFYESLWEGGLVGNGRKFSQAEKMRIMVGMGALYGVPAAGTAAVGWVPVKQVIRDWLTQENVQIEGPALEIFMDGIFPYMQSMMMGEKFDWSASYGPGQGIPAFYDLMQNDAKWADILIGASGGVLADTLGSLFGPTASAVMDMARMDGTGNYAVTSRDLLDPLKNISTVNNSLRMWEAMNTQRWMTRNGQLVADDITKSEALVSFLFGVAPQRVSDAYDQMSAKYSNERRQREYGQEVGRLLRLAVEAGNKGDWDSNSLYVRRAKSYAIRKGLTHTQYSRALQEALRDRPLTEKADEMYRLHFRNQQFRFGPNETE